MMFDNEPCISKAGTLHGWYLLKPKGGSPLTVWVEEFTAFEVVADLLPRSHFSEVAVIPWQRNT
jgi:hypothetical protein